MGHPTATSVRFTDAFITGHIRRGLGDFEDDAHNLTTPSCQRAGGEGHCNAGFGGPAGVNWSVVGEGAAVRRIEVSPWAESS